jgi:hypothetical protein
MSNKEACIAAKKRRKQEFKKTTDGTNRHKVQRQTKERTERQKK